VCSGRSAKFWLGLAAGLTIGIYDYLGYSTTAYLAAEIKDPGRAIPRSIFLAIVAVMTSYLLLQIGVLGAIDWRDMTDPKNPASQSVAAVVVERVWGHYAASALTVLVLVTAFASVFTGLLGCSRVPYDAARDKVFFARFGGLHSKHRFPDLSLVTMVALTALAFLASRHLGARRRRRR
jgi:fructoselysine transporter